MMKIHIILTGSLFEDVDIVMTEQLPGDPTCCMDDQSGDAPKMSDVYTSQVYIPNDHRPSSDSQSPSTATSSQFSNTDDTVNTTS